LFRVFAGNRYCNRIQGLTLDSDFWQEFDAA
jgi:hypothetical protein